MSALENNCLGFSFASGKSTECLSGHALLCYVGVSTIQLQILDGELYT